MNATALQEKKLTLTDAGDQWIAAKEEIDRQKALIAQAEPILRRHFERTGRRVYKDRISYEPTGGNVILDQAKVAAELGPRLPDFQTTSKRGWTLKLLK